MQTEINAIQRNALQETIAIQAEELADQQMKAKMFAWIVLQTKHPDIHGIGI